MQSLSIIGAGHVGKVLARLWRQSSSYEILGILNSSLDSGIKAAEYIGGGYVVESVSDIPNSDSYMITVSDDNIAECYDQLARSHDLSGSVVFHCSGSLPSSILQSRASDKGVASIHPVKSFADVDASVASFEGTFCGYEGDDAALAAILPKFQVIGGVPFSIDPKKKTLYHTAIVFSMNYLVALIDVGLQCYADSGVPNDLALQVLKPILTNALSNVFRLGTARALTGPIARGDSEVVRRQLNDLAERSRDLEYLYALLGKYALEVARQSGNSTERRLDDVAEILKAHLP